MKKELIKTPEYLLVLDDSEIKEGDYGFITSAVMSYDAMIKEWNQPLGSKIIAYLPLNNSPTLEGVPLLPPLEVEDVWSMGLEARLKELPYTKHLDDGMFNDGQVSGFESGAEWGYNKAKEKYKFTEEHAKYLFECGRNFQINADITFTVAREHLSQPKTPTHFDFETEITHEGNGTYSTDLMDIGLSNLTPIKVIKTTTNSQGQEVACGKYIY